MNLMVEARRKTEAWFCYERDFAGRWAPKIYWGEPPPVKGMEGIKKAERSPLIGLNSIERNIYPLSPRGSLKQLAEKYPPPKD
jgi:hypothetical protein